MAGHRLERAALLIEQRRWELAEKELRAVLADRPMDDEAHRLLALCLLEREKLDEAEAEARAAILAAPDDAWCHFTMAQVLVGRRRFDDALRAVAEAIRLEPLEADYHALLAGVRGEQRRWTEALAAADAGLALDPEHVACGNVRALALRQLGRPAEAARAMDGVLAADPDDSTSHANQGWALLERRDREQALHHFREALRLDPGNDWARAGIVEALKARNPVYGLMLRYFLFMARLSGRAQWGLIIGLYVGFQVLRRVAARNPDLAPFIAPLLYAYIGFVFLSWTADALFNLLLRLDRYGRLALSRDQIVASNWVGAMILLALASLAAWLATGAPAAGWGAVFAATLVLPLAGAFRCDAGWPRWLLFACTGALALTALGVVAGLLLDPAGESRLVKAALGLGLLVYVVGLLGSSILANVLAGVRPTR